MGTIILYNIMDSFNYIRSEPFNVCGGYNCKSDGEQSVATGYYAAAMKDNSVAVGSLVSSTHKNATVIGSNLKSKEDNSVVMNNVKITSSGLHLNSGTSLISDTNGVLSSGSKPLRCAACNDPIDHGVKWIKKGYEKENVTYSDISLALCFNCICDCVISFKANQSWVLHHGK